MLVNHLFGCWPWGNEERMNPNSIVNKEVVFHFNRVMSQKVNAIVISLVDEETSEGYTGLFFPPKRRRVCVDEDTILHCMDNIIGPSFVWITNVTSGSHASSLTSSSCIVSELRIKSLKEVETSSLIEVLSMVLMDTNRSCQHNQIMNPPIANAFIPESILKCPKDHVVFNKNVIWAKDTNGSIKTNKER